MKAPNLRFHEVDFLRGFACISVLAFHFLSRGPRHHTMPGIDVPLLDAVARYGYLGVHLFFVISGFVILMSAEGASARSFAASRISRLYPGLWAAATLTAGCAWLLADGRFAVSGGVYLANLSMVPQWFGLPYVDGAYWSLGYELQFYILVWLAIRFGLLHRLELLLAGWLLVSALNALRPMWPVEFWLDARWAPFFVAGGVFYSVRKYGVTPVRLGLLAASFALALCYVDGDRVVESVVITAIFGVFWLIARGRFRMQASPFIHYAGILTYPLYVIHQNLGFMVYGRLLETTGSALASLLLMLVLVLSLSWCVHAYVEKPLGGFLRRRLAGPRSVQPAAETPGAVIR